MDPKKASPGNPFSEYTFTSSQKVSARFWKARGKEHANTCVNLHFEETSWLLIKSVCMFTIPVWEACVQHYRVGCKMGNWTVRKVTNHRSSYHKRPNHGPAETVHFFWHMRGFHNKNAHCSIYCKLWYNLWIYQTYPLSHARLLHLWRSWCAHPTCPQSLASPERNPEISASRRVWTGISSCLPLASPLASGAWHSAPSGT